jgi:hypothetical protein
MGDYTECYDSDSENYEDTEQITNLVKKPTYYPSNIPDSFIVNAVTGVAYPWKVGSNDSKRLFKVYDTLGLHDKHGVKIPKRVKNNSRFQKSEINPNPNQLYYESPQEFMRHQRYTVNPELINSWLKSKNELFNDE